MPVNPNTVSVPKTSGKTIISSATTLGKTAVSRKRLAAPVHTNVASKPTKSIGSFGVSQTKKKRKKSRVFKEIKKLQQQQELFVPKVHMKRLVRDLVEEITPGSEDVKLFPPASLVMVQEFVESQLVAYLESANLLAIHAKRVTLSPKDISLAARVREG